MNAWIFLIVMIFVLVFGFLAVLVFRGWNIPITILRFTGDKRRPMIIQKKGRKKMVKGVPHLFIKGYKQSIRDFKSDFYWPASKGKYGGLILWEFEDGWLTPAVPMKDTPSNVEELVEAAQKMRALSNVKFIYDPEVHHALKLKVVDDVDMEFLVEQITRQDKQYSGGFWAFMDQYGNHVTIIFMVVCLLVGFIIYLKNAPNLSAQCLNQLGEVVREDFLSKVVGASAPGG